MVLNSRQFKCLKNYRNVNVKCKIEREYRDENVFRPHISEREARRPLFPATQARSFLRAKRAAREARDENVRAKREDFFLDINMRVKIKLIVIFLTKSFRIFYIIPEFYSIGTYQTFFELLKCSEIFLEKDSMFKITL